MEQLGEAAVTNGSKYRTERELYIGSLFSLALASRKGTYSWIRKPDGDPPDIELMQLEKTAQGNIRITCDVEIVEFERHNKASLIDVIRKKLENWYPESYTLLCYVWGRKEVIFPDQLHKELLQLTPKLAAIYVMGNTDNSRNVALCQVYPTLDRENFNFIKMANKWPGNLPHGIKCSRGK